ncbi:cytochrome P450 [Mycobacterium sp. 852002-51057_SCH5723018]|uniref:cytochrome P450 n=1 Tax=Mycobacterium sp. 852002-51057_SCH5723018 TaxID=1834094 RepID=UPI0007FDE343|nr:cytochrome P450 [Mycobacterium sp. 852002-51057_SCH5723018]OBG28745.1 cytochrome [Mycobacterium sp. 852002-51057_SCH5723018]
MMTTDVTGARLPWDAANPYPFYEARRAEGDVVWDDTAQAWLVLGYEAARQVLGGAGWTSDPLANPLARASLDAAGQEFTRSSMLFADGPDHQRLRGSVRDVFTRSFVANLTAGIDTIATTLIDRQPADTEFDFMSDIALPLPIAVIGAWLDLEPGSAQLLREVSPVIIRMLGTLADHDEITAGAAASATLMAEFLPMAADRRTHPGDDLLSFIAADPGLSLEEVVMTAILIAVAGHETTANLLGAGLIRLLTPGTDATCIADHIDTTDPAMVTELLRIDGPVQSTSRTATADQFVGGVEIHTGQSALVAVAAANRDPAVFTEPARFRLDRNAPAPLAFGYGAHYCLGAALARLEFSIALSKVLARQPVLAGPVNWRDTPAIRGPLTVPVVFGGP